MKTGNGGGDNDDNLGFFRLESEVY